MKPPRVYRAITAISAELARQGLSKAHRNAEDGYDYRSIDDLLDGLSPLLVKHRLCVLPCTLERSCSEIRDKSGEVITSVAVRVAFDLISSFDGSAHRIAVFGEAADISDKATAKALSSAYKTAMFQAFCVPVRGMPDADEHSIKPAPAAQLAEPAQGWDQWVRDMVDLIGLCEAPEALDRLQSTYRAQLQALRRERRSWFDDIGKSLAARRQQLAAGSPEAGRRLGKQQNSTALSEPRPMEVADA